MLYNLIPKRFRLSKIHERINIQCSVGADKQSRRRRPKTPSNQRLDFLDSFFFLAAGDLDLERLVREELRLVLPRERDLERRRLDADLGLLDLPLAEFVRSLEGDSRRSRDPISGVGDLFGRLR